MKQWWLYNVICLIFLIKLSYQISTPTSPNYVAGVVEFYPKSYGFSYDTVNNRTQEYIQIIESREAIDVDILVFPEGTLNERISAAEIPKPEDLIAPCDVTATEYMQFVRDISCAARRNRKYVVINLTMKRNCTEDSILYNDTRQCPENDINLYNTNVVFDRYGTIISTYRKYNLFGEAGITVPHTVDIATFDTDFGVKFGHFICFDILFETPAISLINLGIKHIIFPTMWFSGMPFLTAVQVQQAWAERFNVNFLAAGASNPLSGSTGTGIFNGINGALGTLMAAAPITRLIVAKIDKNLPMRSKQLEAKFLIKDDYDDDDDVAVDNKNDNISIDNRYTDAMLPLHILNEDMTNYSYSFLNFNNNQEINRTVCSNEDFCCDFSVRVSTGVLQAFYYRYYAVAFYGNRTFSGFAEGGIFTCAVIACTNNSMSTCGLRFPEGTYGVNFRFSILNLQITSNYTPKTFDVPMPNSLNAHIMPLNPREYKYEEIGNFTHPSSTDKRSISMTLLNPRPDILTFGFYGRRYPTDFVENAGTTNYITFSLLLLCILINAFKFIN